MLFNIPFYVLAECKKKEEICKKEKYISKCNKEKGFRLFYISICYALHLHRPSSLKKIQHFFFLNIFSALNLACQFTAYNAITSYTSSIYNEFMGQSHSYTLKNV